MIMDFHFMLNLQAVQSSSAINEKKEKFQIPIAYSLTISQLVL